mgnify:CR=1 FL=1
MIRLLATLAFAACALAPATRAFASRPLAQPYQMVRSLRILQDQVAAGKTDALPLLRLLLLRIGDEFRDVDAQAWTKPRNQFAAVTYLLNGGNPDAVRAALGTKGSAPELAALFKGAFAYSDGDTATMLKAFGDLHPSDLPFDLIDSVYLVSAAPLAESDPLTALDRLDHVRLTAPGTLLEEAAIRRSLGLAGRLGKTHELRLLARNYLTRFGSSPFRRDFAVQLCAGIIRLGGKITDAGIAEIGDLAAPEERLEFYLQLARSSLLAGQPARARFAADRASALAAELGSGAVEANLYAQIGDATGPDVRRAAAELSATPRGELAPADAALLQAALTVAAQILREPASGASGAVAVPGNGPEVEDTPARQAEQNAFALTMAGAKQALAEADRLLAGDSR